VRLTFSFAVSDGPDGPGRPDGHLYRMIITVIICYHLCRKNHTLIIVRNFSSDQSHLHHTNKPYDINANVMRQFVNDYTVYACNLENNI